MSPSVPTTRKVCGPGPTSTKSCAVRPVHGAKPEPSRLQYAAVIADEAVHAKWASVTGVGDGGVVVSETVSCWKCAVQVDDAVPAVTSMLWPVPAQPVALPTQPLNDHVAVGATVSWTGVPGSGDARRHR